MKIIDLYNKIANGEELPEYIQWRNFKFKKCDIGEEYYSFDCGMWLFKELDSSVLNEEIKVLEQEKKIPEKLKIRYKDNETLVNEKILQEDINDELASKINEIIDYLKSKGDE